MTGTHTHRPIKELRTNLSMVAQAFQLSAHVLISDPDQLTGQLVGRLMSIKSQAVQEIIQQGIEKKQTPWLRPMTPTLIPPGGPLVRSLIGASTPVKSLAITADSRYAIAGYFDHTVKVWDLETGAEFRSLRGHTAMVTAVAVNQDGRIVVSGCDDGHVKVWDVERGILIWSFDTEDIEGVTAVTITSDGKFAASGTRMGKIHVWDLESGNTIARMEHSGSINTSLDYICLMQDSRHLTSVLYDGADDEAQVKVWDFQNRREIISKDLGEVNGPGGIRFTVDGDNLMVIMIDGTFQSWDLRTMRVVRTIKVSPNTFVPSPDGHLGILFPDDDDNALDICELEDQKPVCRLSFRSDLESMTSGSFTADGKRFVSSHDNGKLLVWKVGSQEENDLNSPHPGHVLSIHVSLDGTRAITGSWEWEHVVWDLNTLSILNRLKFMYERSNTVISQNGSRAIDIGNNGVILWDLERGVQLKSLSSQPSTTAVLTNDDSIMISADSRGFLHVTDITSGKQLRTIPGHDKEVNRIIKTSNERWVVTTSDDGTAKVWDPEFHGEVARFSHGDSVTYAALSGDDCRLLTGSTASIRVWDLQTYAQIDQLPASSGHQFMDAVITKDGRRVIFYTSPIMGSQGSSIGVWFVGQGGEVRGMEGLTGGVSTIQQTPDGKSIISISGDNLKVWNLEVYKTAATFTGEGKLTSCAVTSKGLVIAGEETGWVHFLRLENAIPPPPVSKYIPEKHQPLEESSSVIIRDDLEELTSPPPDLTSHNVDDLYTKGLQLFNSEDFQGALDCFESIIKLQPRNSEAHLLHLSTLLRLERRQDAIDSADDVLENQLVSEEHLASLYMLKSSAQIGLRQFEQGLETLEHSLDLDDGNAAGWEIRARTYSETGDYQQALDSYLKMCELEWSEETEAIIGLCYLHLDDIDQAETTFKSLIEDGGTLPLTYYGYGLCLIMKNESDEACKWLKRFLEDPGEQYPEIIPQAQQIVDKIC